MHWENVYWYTFPSLNTISGVLQKLEEEEEAERTMIVPMWQTQFVVQQTS